MSVARYTGNPMDFTERTLDGNRVTLDNWINPSAKSSVRSTSGCLAEQASLTGYEPNEQLDDMTSNNFSSVQGDSGMSSVLKPRELQPRPLRI